MSFSQTNTISSEIVSDDPLSPETQAYLEARAKNAFYDYIYSKFRKAESEGLTKAKLARRVNKKPDQISHLLGAPGNWTISTIALLLAAICKEEIIPSSVSFLNRPSRNMQPVDFLAEKYNWIIQTPQVDGTGLQTSTQKSKMFVNISI